MSSLSPSLPAAGWRLALYPSAGEAGGSFRHSWQPSRTGGGGESDPERVKAEADRRARAEVRRYCAANRLNRLGTLTYRGAGCHEPRQLPEDVAGFWRALRRQLDGEALPYAWVPEWYPGGHGLHVQFAVGRYSPSGRIDADWGHGFVHIKLLGDHPVGSGPLYEARHAARYLAKYVSKDFGVPRDGLHRYEVAQGFQSAVERLHGRTSVEALAAACERMGGPPAEVWDSGDEADWQGPPAVWAAWS